MFVLFRRFFRTAIFSRFSKVVIATSNFMNEFYNGRFSPEFSVSMLKEIIAVVRETRKQEAETSIWNEEIRSNTSGKYIWKRNMKSFSNETLNFFLQKVLFLLHFGSCQNCMSSANLVAEIHIYIYIYIYIYIHIIILILTNTYNINWWFLFNPKKLFFCLLLTVHQDSKIHGCWVWKQVNTKIKFNFDKNLDAKK